MKKDMLIIRPLLPKDIPIVVNIHRHTIQSPGSEIGVSYLTHVYQSVCDDPHLAKYRLVPGFAPLGFGMVAEVQKAGLLHIVGVILVCHDVARFGNIIQMVSNPRVLLNLIIGIVSGRITLRQLINHRKFQNTVDSLYHKPYVSIQAISVVEDVQRMGIGKALVDAVKKATKSQNVRRLYIDTLKTNHTAQKFYASVGFRKLREAGDSILFSLLL